MASGCARGGLVGYWEKFPQWKGFSRPGTAAHGRGGVPSLGGFQSCDTWGHGQGWPWQCWGWMVSRAFSTLNNSMVPGMWQPNSKDKDNSSVCKLEFFQLCRRISPKLRPSLTPGWEKGKTSWAWGWKDMGMLQILAQIIPLGSDIPSVASLGRIVVGLWHLHVPDPALQFQFPQCNLECLGGFLTGQVWEVTQPYREGEFVFLGRLELLQPPG